MKTLFMPKLGIVVIRLWIPYLCPLRRCGNQPHKVYGDLPLHFGEGHTQIQVHLVLS